jgi:hypothetical protein
MRLQRVAKGLCQAAIAWQCVQCNIEQCHCMSKDLDRVVEG